MRARGATDYLTGVVRPLLSPFSLVLSIPPRHPPLPPPSASTPPTVILVNATNPATRDFYGIAASEVYEPRPLKQPVKLVIFRGGRYVNRGRGGVTNVAFLGCHPGSSAAARAVTFVPPEQCARGKGKGGGGR